VSATGKKQGVAAKRVHARLEGTYPDFDCSYRTVASHVKEKKREIYSDVRAALIGNTAPEKVSTLFLGSALPREKKAALHMPVKKSFRLFLHRAWHGNVEDHRSPELRGEIALHNSENSETAQKELVSFVGNGHTKEPRKTTLSDSRQRQGFRSHTAVRIDKSANP
jgi:hypothetical protein